MKPTLCFLLLAGLASHSALGQQRTARPATPAQQRHQLAAFVTAQLRPAATVLRPGQVVGYRYEASSGTWVEPRKTTFGYDAAGQTTAETVADSATGTPLNRTFITYNAARQVTESRSQYYLGGAWADASRELFSYDNQQQLAEQQQQYADNSGTWHAESGVRYLTTYNAAAQRTAQTVRVLRPATGTYADSVRYFFTVAAGGGNAWTARITQELDSGRWLNTERQVSVVWHDVAQQQQASARSQAWTGQAWLTVARLQGTYTPVSQEIVVQDSLPGTWQNDQRTLARYDANGNLTDAQLADWNGTAWATFLGTHYQYAYNPDQSVQRRLTSVDWGNGLELDKRENFSNYQALTLASHAAPPLPGGLQAYPNPSPDGQFTLELATPAASGQVQVFDALGREVARTAWAGPARSRCALDLSGQRPGRYLVRLTTAAGVAHRAVSVE